MNLHDLQAGTRYTLVSLGNMSIDTPHAQVVGVCGHDSSAVGPVCGTVGGEAKRTS
jgi:hypothetical protein